MGFDISVVKDIDYAGFGDVLSSLICENTKTLLVGLRIMPLLLSQILIVLFCFLRMPLKIALLQLSTPRWRVTEH